MGGCGPEQTERVKCAGADKRDGQNARPFQRSGWKDLLVGLHGGPVGVEGYLVVLAGFEDGGFVADDLAVAGEGLDLARFGAVGSFENGGLDGGGKGVEVDLVFGLYDVAGGIEGDVAAAAVFEELHLVGGDAFGDVLLAGVDGGAVKQGVALLLHGRGEGGAGYGAFGRVGGVGEEEDRGEEGRSKPKVLHEKDGSRKHLKIA